MGTSSRLATMLDADMLARHQKAIAHPGTPDSKLKKRSAQRVTWELGGRYLLRYLTTNQVINFAHGVSGIPTDFSNNPHYVTPTPFSPEEAIAWLALPSPHLLRNYVVLLDPALIPVAITILGPRWVRMGGGIEYILSSFPIAAVVNVGTGLGTQWPLLVN